MWMLVTITTALATGALFWFFAPLRQLYDAFQPMTVALSIMAAALLVRLNRGMPALDWRGHAGDRKRVTALVVEIAREYLIIIATTALLLVLLTVLITLRAIVSPPAPAIGLLPVLAEHVLSATIGGLAAFCMARMAYVLWRDYDIVKLQKKLIDQAGDIEEAARQAKIADEKVAAMHATGLRPVRNGEPKGYDA